MIIEIKSVVTETYESDPTTHRITATHPRTGPEVFADLQEKLETLGLLPDDYFMLSSLGDRLDQRLPPNAHFNARVDFGDSEGIYIDIVCGAVQGGEYVEIPFATGKRLKDEGNVLLRMSETASTTDLLLNGNGRTFEIDHSNFLELDAAVQPALAEREPEASVTEFREIQDKLTELSREIQNDHDSTFAVEAVLRQLDAVSETIRLTKRYPRPPELDPDIPWNESAESEYELDPYVYKGTMSVGDFEKAQKLYFTNPDRSETEEPLHTSVRKTIYVCSPLAGEIQANIRKAREYSKFVAKQGATPIAPHITELFDDTIPEERELGLEMGLDYLRKADELWVFGKTISNGMAAEIKLAQEELHIPIYQVDAPPYEVKAYDEFEKAMKEENLSEKDYTISVSQDPIDNRCTLYFNDGDRIDVRGEAFGVNFPEMGANEVSRFIESNLADIKLLDRTLHSPIAALKENSGYYVLDETKYSAIGFNPVAPDKLVIWRRETSDGDFIGHFGSTLNLFEIADLRFLGFDMDKVTGLLKEINFEYVEHIASKMQERPIAAGQPEMKSLSDKLKECSERLSSDASAKKRSPNKEQDITK